MSLNLLAPNLWIANQPLRFLGLRVGTRMTIIRLRDRSLVVIRQASRALAELEALGL